MGRREVGRRGKRGKMGFGRVHGETLGGTCLEKGFKTRGRCSWMDLEVADRQRGGCGEYVPDYHLWKTEMWVGGMGC